MLYQIVTVQPIIGTEICTYEVEAPSKEEASEKVLKGEVFPIDYYTDTDINGDIEICSVREL